MIYTDDLFDILSNAAGCVYGSNLHREPYRRIAVAHLIKMDLEPYSMKTLIDIADYLFGDTLDFKNAPDAKEYFKTMGKKRYSISEV